VAYHSKNELLIIETEKRTCENTQLLTSWFRLKIKLFLKNFIPELPPSVDRCNFFLFEAWFRHEMNIIILKNFKMFVFLPRKLC